MTSPADPRVTTLLADEGIAVERGEFLVLRRHLFRDGKSKAYVAGRLSSAATLRALGEGLVDIHGQHPGQPLLDPKRHREFLDAYAGIVEDVRDYRERYLRWQGLGRERRTHQAQRERARFRQPLEPVLAQRRLELRCIPCKWACRGRW